jgi:hypothetical protein
MERDTRERIRTVERQYKREIVLYRHDGERTPERR